MKQEKLIIFDLDGLLVDTEKLFYRGFKQAAKKRGITLPTFSEYVSKVVSTGLSVAELVGLRGPEANGFKKDVYDRYRRILEEDLEPLPGAVSCLEKLTNYHLVLVTGSKREFTESILLRTGMKTYFEKAITRDDGFPPKPDPSVFQHLLSDYKVKNWECVVIDDSNRGISAALAAKIPAIVVPNDYTRDWEFGPRVTKVRRLEDVTVELVESTMDRVRPKADHTLMNLYGDSLIRLEEIFSIYKDIYGLNEYLHVDSNVTPEAFEYATKRSHFIILAMLTKDGRVFFQRSFDTGHLSMLLPGNAVHMDEEEDMLEAIHRTARRILENARLADISPVAYLINRFKCTDGRTAEHKGLGVRALLLNDDNELARYIEDNSIKGAFLHNFPESEIPQLPSRNTYTNVKQWLLEKDYSTYVNEIEGQSAVIWRYRFHQSFANPLLKALSYAFGKYSIKYVKRRVIELLQGMNSFLDVACGDDRSIFAALKKVPLVVANDISVDQLDSMKSEYLKRQKKMPKANAILFTNHDCLDLPFRENAFEAVLCRNVLHHMRTARDLKVLLRNIRRVGKRVIIVEIQDPSKESVWGRLRHLYYMHFLHDEGRSFYFRDDFENVIGRHFNGDKIEYEYLHTIRGVYMAAIINKMN